MNNNEAYSVLSIYPTSKGFAFAFFESPNDLIDFRHCEVRPYCKDKLMGKVKYWIDYFQPDILVLPNCEKKGHRVSDFIRIVVEHAHEVGLSYKYYSRTQIKEFFQGNNRFDIANQIVDSFPDVLSLEKVQKPRIWMSEINIMSIFDVISIGIIAYV